MKSLLLASVSIFLALFLTFPVCARGSKKEKALSHAEVVGQQIIVQFKSENEALHRKELFEKFGTVELQKIGTAPLYLIEASPTASVPEIIEKLKKEPGVKFAEPNTKLKLMPHSETR